VENAVKKASEVFGNINSLIVSAGIQRYGTATSTTDEQWNEVLDVNLRGAWNLARAGIPFLREQGGGTIVNVSSVQALATQQNVLAYTVSKHGMVGLTRSIAMDFARERLIRRCSNGRLRLIQIQTRFMTLAMPCTRLGGLPNRGKLPK
jgi:NAD(P)-dependent dehydrogenase (short-subunit alcohol dehydrogenase family)